MNGKLIDLIKSRRSIRAFTDEAISEDIIELLLEGARWAPCGGNLQTWRFCVVDDRETIEHVAAFSPGLMGSPPLLIVLCVDKEQAFAKGGELFRDTITVMDISMAAQNIMLLAEEAGLGSCAVKSFNPAGVGGILRLPGHILPELIVTVGHPKDKGVAASRKPLNEITFSNTWSKSEKG
jgi:nitroreductase